MSFATILFFSQNYEMSKVRDVKCIILQLWKLRPVFMHLDEQTSIAVEFPLGELFKNDCIYPPVTLERGSEI